MKAYLKTIDPVPGRYPARISGYQVRFTDSCGNIYELEAVEGVRGICDCFVIVTQEFPVFGRIHFEVEF